MGLSLITAAEYKAYKGISSTTQDAAINALIPKVSELVKSFCRRTFLDYVGDAKVEVFKGGEAALNLKETPLIAVASVEYSNDFGLTYTPLVEYTDYVVDFETDQVNLIATYYQAIKQVNAFKVTYTAGYETLPTDLKLAVMDLVHYYLHNETALHTSKNVGANSVQIEYVTNTSLPAHIRRVLDLYCANYL
jgi:hypothetical protein